ncbi:MAG TPA: hypothetical protein PLZ51_27955, partial [Aggregatilineales bacterium]|nr:hypothetical protein [Aggregatilineales bacterium]
MPSNILTGVDWSKELDFWTIFAPYADKITYDARRIDGIRYDVFEITLSGEALYKGFFEEQVKQV